MSRVAVVIATRDNAEALRPTLKSVLVSAERSRFNTEVVVIDNGSTDHTSEVCSEFGHRVRRLSAPERGKSRAYNQWVPELEADAVLFTDDDVRVNPDWIDDMSSPLLDGRWQAVVGPSRIATHLRQAWMGPVTRIWFVENNFSGQTTVGTVIGLNFGVSGSLVKNHMVWDERLGPGALGFCDDNLLGLQLASVIGDIGVVHEAQVTHHFDPQRLNPVYLRDRANRQGQSSGYLAWHWFGRRHRWPLGREIYFGVRLRVRLLLQRLSRSSENRISEQECRLREKLFYAKQYRIERALPRNYG